MDEIDDLRARVQEQQELIDELQAKVAANEHLEARLAHLERLVDHQPLVPPAAPVPVATAAPPEPAGTPDDVDAIEGANDQDGGALTDRRRLLTRAATAAAGAVAGGTALAIAQAGPAAAASGTFDGNPAVDATAIGNTATAVRATATGGIAVQSLASSGTSIQAVNAAGTGVEINGGKVGMSILAGSVGTHMLLTTGTTIPAPPSSSTPRQAGAIVRDTTGDLWLCVASGTPGTWRRVSGTNTAGALTMLNAPVRVYDSRPGNPPNIGSKTKLANGASRTVDCALNGSGVPAGAQAVLANVTVVNTSASGFLTAYRNGISPPAASTINWFLPNTIAANTTVIACNLAQIACYVPPNSSTDFFIDIVGYYR